jgi:hypothetical protein
MSSVPRVDIQTDKIVDVLVADNLIHGSLVETVGYGGVKCESAGHCAIGALLFVAGKTNAELVEMPAEPSEFATEDQLLLYNTYGLTVSQAGMIASDNDSVRADATGGGLFDQNSPDMVARRRETVINRVRTFTSSEFDGFDFDDLDAQY